MDGLDGYWTHCNEEAMNLKNLNDVSVICRGEVISDRQSKPKASTSPSSQFGIDLKSTEFRSRHDDISQNTV
jgi:hypothetical protein